MFTLDGTKLIYTVDVTVSYKVGKKTVKEADTLYLMEDQETGLGTIGGGDRDGCGAVGVQRAWDRKDLAYLYRAFATGKAAPTLALDNGIKTVMDHLEERMSDPRVPPRKISIHPLHVRNRDSTGFVHHDKDAVIAKALAFIARETAVRKIGVNDVVRHVKCSRRTLEMHFRKGLKRSILDEIRRRQLDRVRELLVGTSMSVGEIAGKTGFLSVNRLENRFASVYGTTMRSYRRKKHSPTSARPS